MITLEKFKEIIETTKKFDEDNDKLSKILCTENTGFVDYHFKITSIIEYLLNEAIDNDDPDLISWWQWEKVPKIITWNGVQYNVENIEDLYYWLTKQYDKVKCNNQETQQA